MHAYILISEVIHYYLKLLSCKHIARHKNWPLLKSLHVYTDVKHSVQDFWGSVSCLLKINSVSFSLAMHGDLHELSLRMLHMRDS